MKQISVFAPSQSALLLFVPSSEFCFKVSQSFDVVYYHLAKKKIPPLVQEKVWLCHGNFHPPVPGISAPEKGGQ